MEFLRSVETWLNEPLLHLGDWDLSAFVLIRLIVYPLLAVVAARLVRRYLMKGLQKRQHLDQASRNTIATVGYYLALFLGLAVALNAAEMPIQNLAVFSGAIGLGLGLGLQQFAQNFFSGLIVLFARPVRVGDWVTVDGSEGEVKEIGVYSALVHTAEDGELVIPNAQLLNGKVINWTRSRMLRRVSVTVSLSRTADLGRLKEVLLAGAHAADGSISKPAPSVKVLAVRKDAADLEVLAYTKALVTNPSHFSSNLLEAIEGACRAAKIDMG